MARPPFVLVVAFIVPQISPQRKKNFRNGKLGFIEQMNTPHMIAFPLRGRWQPLVG